MKQVFETPNELLNELEEICQGHRYALKFKLLGMRETGWTKPVVEMEVIGNVLCVLGSDGVKTSIPKYLIEWLKVRRYEVCDGDSYKTNFELFVNPSFLRIYLTESYEKHASFYAVDSDGEARDKNDEIFIRRSSRAERRASLRAIINRTTEGLLSKQRLDSLVAQLELDRRYKIELLRTEEALERFLNLNVSTMYKENGDLVCYSVEAGKVLVGDAVFSKMIEEFEGYILKFSLKVGMCEYEENDGVLAVLKMEQVFKTLSPSDLENNDIETGVTFTLGVYVKRVEEMI